VNLQNLGHLLHLVFLNYCLKNQQLQYPPGLKLLPEHLGLHLGWQHLAVTTSTDAPLATMEQAFPKHSPQAAIQPSSPRW
jgi:hypothetical protein